MIEPSNQGSRISWERARTIFGNAAPPSEVWESQFDYSDDDLKRLAATPFQEIDASDLWYYFHDLAHVTLQPDLFDYLFPVCLMDWHKTLMSNEPCSHGDSEFHRGLLLGNVLEKMLTPLQRDNVFEFFRDSFLERLDAERGFAMPVEGTTAFAWLLRFNSLALVMSRIDSIWNPWWNIETPGRAVCTLQYCSGLIYYADENPVFDSRLREWIREAVGKDSRIELLEANDAFALDHGWLQPNIEFVKRTLSFDYVLERVQWAADRLATEPERDMARKIATDAPHKRETIELMIEELPRFLIGENRERPALP